MKTVHLMISLGSVVFGQTGISKYPPESGAVACTGSVTTNCFPKADGSGNVAIGNTLPVVLSNGAITINSVQLNTAAGITALWSGTCNSTSLLGGDGICKVISSAFSAIASGTNTTAAMVCGTGCSLTHSGTGTVTATGGSGAPWVLSDGSGNNTFSQIDGNHSVFYGFDHTHVLLTIQTSGNFLTIGDATNTNSQFTFLTGGYLNSSTDGVQSHKNVSMYNPASGVWAFGLGSNSGAGATLQYAVEQLGTPVAVASLPACASGTLYSRRPVNDATSATPGTTASGSGTFSIIVQCTFNSSGSAYTWIID